MIRPLITWLALSTFLYSQYKKVEAPINTDGRTLSFHIYHWEDGRHETAIYASKADLQTIAKQHKAKAAITIQHELSNISLQQLTTKLTHLVDQQKVRGLSKSDNTHTRRTFLLTNKKNRWAIGYAPSVSTEQLATALQHICTNSSPQYTHAYILNSGIESAFWVNNGEYNPFYLKGRQTPSTTLLVKKIAAH